VNALAKRKSSQEKVRTTPVKTIERVVVEERGVVVRFWRARFRGEIGLPERNFAEQYREILFCGIEAIWCGDAV
jgi:hypothetical protein